MLRTVLTPWLMTIGIIQDVMFSTCPIYLRHSHQCWSKFNTPSMICSFNVWLPIHWMLSKLITLSQWYWCLAPTKFLQLVWFWISTWHLNKSHGYWRCLLWFGAKKCFILSKETIPDNDYHSCPMNSPAWLVTLPVGETIIFASPYVFWRPDCHPTLSNRVRGIIPSGKQEPLGKSSSFTKKTGIGH